MENWKIIFFLLSIFIGLVTSFLPGLDHNYYKEGEIVEVKTRSLVSSKDLPFDYYSLKFCRPDPLVSAIRNIGEILFGDNIENSLYQIKMLTPVSCKRLKNVKSEGCPGSFSCVTPVCPLLTPPDAKDFISKIANDYKVQLLVDNLPVANLQSPSLCGELPENVEGNPGYVHPDSFPVGCPRDNKDSFIINNHLTFKLSYHQNVDKSLYSVVGAAVTPSSIDHDATSCMNDDDPMPKALPKKKISDVTTDITWSYSVIWEKSDVRWASRWDAYLSLSNPEEYKIHWFSIINSLMVVFFLTGMVAVILLRVLHKDIQFYNSEQAAAADPSDESGWKMVHGDVFRKPRCPTLFSIVNGSGVQVVGVAIVSLLFAAIGFVSPANRGALMTLMLILFVFMGLFSGYFALRLYKMFDGEYWKWTTALTAFCVPSVVFGLFLLINFVVAISSSSSLAAPFLSILLIMALWFGISLPLVFLGGFFGFQQEKIQNPGEVHRIPRQLPSQVWYMQAPFTILVGGILPFGAVFIELYFIMSSIWLHRSYVFFMFVFIALFILLATCSEMTIVLTYFQLCNADYVWWWRSFFTSGSSALYLFLYTIFYYYSKLRAPTSFVMGFVYFGYMAILSYFFFILTGSIGFFACFWFIRTIYGSIKVE